MSEGEKKDRTKIGQPPAQTPEAVEEEAVEEADEQTSQPSPTSEPGEAPSTPLQTEQPEEDVELELTDEVEDDDEEEAAEPAPAAVAAPPLPSPVAQTTPSETAAETREVPPSNSLKPSWWKKADRWANSNTNVLGIFVLMAFVWAFVIIAAIMLGPLAFHKVKAGIYEVKNMAKATVTMMLPSKKVAKPAPPPTPLEPPVIECINYTVAQELDGSLSTKNCECKGDNCPVKIVCKGDQYKVTYNWRTVTNPDDTEQRFVESTVVDTSNCEHFY